MAPSSAILPGPDGATPRSGPLLEVLALTLLFLSYAILVVLLKVPTGPQIVVTITFLSVILSFSWLNFRQGMHPVFLFVGLLVLFQGGGLLAYIFSGGSSDPLTMYLAELPFDLSLADKSETLLLVLVSALCIYLPIRLSRSQVEYAPPSNTDLLPFLVLILLVCLPFHFWKNYEYFVYVRSHGGYLAIFRSDEHITEAGFLVRGLSQLCSSAFLVYFVYERPGRRMFCLSFLYFAISIVELMIGLRGKVMLLFVCFLFLWKLKRQNGFRLRGLLFLVLFLAAVAQSVAMFRENKEKAVEVLETPVIFLSGEGVAINVTEAAVAFYPQFAPYRWNYVAHGVRAIFQSEATPQARSPQGEVLDNDTSMYLNRPGFDMGFGTGGSYIAEGYLFGKLFGVIGESLLIAGLLIIIAHNLHGWRTPYAWTVMLSIVYLPRANLTTLLSAIAHSSAGVFAVFCLAWGLARSADFFHQAGDAAAITSRT
jgi:oligosaccharide repeat unit polymerase